LEGFLGGGEWGYRGEFFNYVKGSKEENIIMNSIDRRLMVGWEF
jgi:hypothetical protein